MTGFLQYRSRSWRTAAGEFVAGEESSLSMNQALSYHAEACRWVHGHTEVLGSMPYTMLLQLYGSPFQLQNR